MREMKKRGIETHLGHKLNGFTGDRVKTEGGDFPADLILFMPGMTGNPWFDRGKPGSPRDTARHNEKGSFGDRLLARSGDVAPLALAPSWHTSRYF